VEFQFANPSINIWLHHIVSWFGDECDGTRGSFLLLARKIRDRRVDFHPQSKLFMEVWLVPKSDRFPDGFKYSFSFIHRGERLLAYDNYEGKGHHRHCKGREEPYSLLPEPLTIQNLDKLEKRFLEEVKQLRAELGETRE